MVENSVGDVSLKRIVRTSDHRSHYVTGAIPQWTKDDLRLHLYNEILEGIDGYYYTSTSQLIIPRSALKSFLDTLRSAIKNDTISENVQATDVPPSISRLIEGAKQEEKIKKIKPGKKKVQKIRWK